MNINSEGISTGSISKINAAMEKLVSNVWQVCLTSLKAGQAVTFN